MISNILTLMLADSPDTENLIFRFINIIITSNFQVPECDSDEDDDFKQQVAGLRTSMPFDVVVVISSSKVTQFAIWGLFVCAIIHCGT